MNALEAIQKADEVRFEIAKLKRAVADGTVDPVEAIKTCRLPMPALDVVLAIRGVADKKAAIAFRDAGVPTDVYLGESKRKLGRSLISRRQRAALARTVAERTHGYEQWRVAA